MAKITLTTTARYKERIEREEDHVPFCTFALWLYLFSDDMLSDH